MSQLVTILVVLIMFTSFTMTATMTAYAQPQRELVAELVPAPVGYSYSFLAPYPDYISGVRDSGGHFYPYRAAISDTGTLVYVSDNPNIASIVGALNGPLKVIEVYKLDRVYGLDFPGDNDLIIYGQGDVYISRYDIYYGAPPSNASRYTVIINEHYVDFRNKYIKVLVIVGTNPITIVRKDGVEMTVRLSDLLGVSDSCITWFHNPPPYTPWVGGLILSPSCTKNVKVLKTFTYNDRPYGVIFKVNSPYGKIDYVIMGSARANVLADAGLLTKVASNKKIHIINNVDLSGLYVYTAQSPTAYPVKGEVFHVEDATHVVENNKYVCILPSDYKVIYALLWKNRDLRGTVELQPGEIILFESGGKHYVCHGDLKWLDNNDMPIIKAPAYRELIHPIILYTISGQEFLVVLSNGEVYAGNHLEIPYEKYEENEIFVVAVNTIQPIYVSLSSIFTSGFFVLAVIIVMVMAGTIISHRGEKTPEKIKIILDMPVPKAHKLASRETIYTVSRKHIEAFGICPDDIDLAVYHGVLPPLPKGVPADEPIVFCPFKTNHRTEYILREIARILRYGFWGVARKGPSHGYIYTLLGEQIFYMYFYKQEYETSPERIMLNALLKAMKTKIYSPFHKRSLGLLIIVEPEMLEKIKKEIEYLEILSRIPAKSEKVRGYNIAGYLSVKIGDSVKIGGKEISFDTIQKFVNEHVPVIIPVSITNITELIEYLSENYSSSAELYYKHLRGE